MMSTQESRSAVRVLIVDDHPVVRAGLASLLRRQEGVKLAGAAHSGEEALEMLERSSVDVVLLDLRMPTINGIDLLNVLKTRDRFPRAIILSSYEFEEEIFQAFKAGARGYLSAAPPSMPTLRWVRAQSSWPRCSSSSLRSR